MAHKHGIPVFVDGVQAAPQMAMDLQDLECDFYAFSPPKMGGPTRIGILNCKEEWLDKLFPLQGGEDISEKITFE